jgi:hypothetical protein
VNLGAAISQLQGSMNVLMETLTPEQQAKLLLRAEFGQAVDNYERKLKPFAKVWKALSIVAAGVAFLFGAGMAYQQFLGGNATKADIQKHVTEEFTPVKVQVDKHTEMIENVGSGVNRLVKHAEAERLVEEAQQTFDIYTKEHEEKLAEWTVAKHAGKHLAKPQRRTELVDAEKALKRAKEELIRVR